MTAPAVPASDTIRQARGSVASDITRARRRVAELSAQLRAEALQLASLQAIAEVVGITDVAPERTPDLVDADVEGAKGPETPEPRQLAG